MKVQCEYCNSWIDDTDEKCPNCGGVNKAYKRTTDQTPKTIEELKQWYVNHHLPPEETTRFFIGRNYQQPRAFGIYQNEKGEFIVYKNKDNGQRAIRYQGTDEAYAVNELYMKLKEEILNQKRNSQLRKNGSSKSQGAVGKVKKAADQAFTVASYIICGAAVVIAIATWISSCSLVANRHEGYYKVDDKMLYHYYNTWYEYEDYGYDTVDDTLTGGWVESDEDYDQYQDIWDYNLGENYDSSSDWDYGVERFTDSSTYDQAYEDHHSSSSDSSDSSYDWSSSDSWDSGSSDWGSDW